MNEKDLIATQTIKQVSEGGDKVRADLKATANAQDQLAASSVNLGNATETSAKRQTSAAAAFDQWSRKVDPASRAMAELEKNQRTYDRTLAQNSQTLDRAGQDLTVYAGKLNAAAVAAENLRRQQSNMTTNTTVQSVQNPTQILGTQLSNVNTKNYAAEFEAAAAAQDKMTASVARLRAQINPLEAEQGKLGAETAYYNDLLKKQAITQDEFNAHQAITSKRLGDFEKNLRTAGTAGRVMSGELANMSFQLNDVVTGLALGQSPFMIIAQQGGQVVQILQQSRASIGEFASAEASSFMSIFTVGRLVFGGIATAILAAGAAMVSFNDSQRLAAQSLIGIGQKTGSTIDQINDFARSNASAVGLSVDQARTAAIEFTKTGNITVTGLKGVGDAIHGFSILTGQDAADSTKELAQAFSGNLVQAAEKLNKTYGFLDSSGREYIRTLEAQGDRSKAIQFILDQMSKDSLKAAESVGVLAQAWDFLGNKISKAKDLIGGANLKNAGTAGLGGTEFMQMAAPQNQQVPANFSERFGDTDPAKIEAVVKQLKAWSLAADDITRSTIPAIDQTHKLEESLAKLIEARDTPGVPLAPDISANLNATITAQQNLRALTKETKDETERYNIEVQNISSSWGNVGQAVALQLQAMQNALPVARAWTEAGKMKAQYEATYLDLLNKGKTQEEARAVAAKQFELSQAAAQASAQKMVQSSEDNLAKIQAQGTEMEGVVASSIAYRDAIQAGASATQAAAIAANTLQANLLQAAKAADQVAQSTYAAKTAADEAAQAKFGHFGQQANFFSGDTGTHDITGIRNDYLNLGGQDAQSTYNLTADRISQTASLALMTGGFQAALAAVTALPNTTGADAFVQLANRGGYNVEQLFGAERSTVPDKISTIDSLFQSQPGDKTANNNAEIAYLRSNLPASIERDTKIAELTQAIGGLTTSTDSLNRTNQDLLSPYYTQDPRTSHIGFRSQGMASGGEFTVPGGYSSNDNMVGTIPLASGEIVSVRRPGDASATTQVHIVNNISIGAGANVDQFKRTLFQNTQNTVRQIRAAS